MALPNSLITRELTRLGDDFASINISNGHVTSSKSRSKAQIPDKIERSLLLTIQIGNNSNDEGTIPGATVSQNLYSLILDSSQYITLSEAGQHSTRIRFYFHSQFNCFMDYVNDPVLDGTVIYAGDILFWYNEHEGTYT